MSNPSAEGREGPCLVLGTGGERRLVLPLLMGIPGLTHAFTTRGADPELAIAAAAGRPLPIFSLQQVHGRQVHAVEDQEAHPSPGRFPRGDVLITRRRKAALQVKVADCVPVILCDPVSGWLGAVHAGWRGTVAGAVREAIGALRRRGARSTDLLVALGPSIGRCCFEVGPEVAAAFEESGTGDEAVVVAGFPPRVDLIEANRRQVLQEGVPEERIASADLCTACRPDLLESHRRSGGGAERTAALIAWTD